MRIASSLVLFSFCGLSAWCTDVVRLGPGFQETYTALQVASDAASDGDVHLRDARLRAPTRPSRHRPGRRPWSTSRVCSDIEVEDLREVVDRLARTAVAVQAV